MTLSSSSSFEIQNSSQVSCDLEFSNSPPGETLECYRQFENLQDIDSGQVWTHNLSISNLFKMEEDCEETSTMSHPPSDMNDITQQLTSLSTQINAQNIKSSKEFLQLVQTNTTFKQEVCAEIDELRAIISDLKQTSASQTPSSSNIKKPSVTVSKSSPIQGSVYNLT